MATNKYNWKEAEGQPLRVIVGVTTYDAMNGYSSNKHIRILPSDLCFTIEGNIVFANTIVPMNGGGGGGGNAGIYELINNIQT